MAGYGITCDRGDLYNRRCYVQDPSDPSKKQEIPIKTYEFLLEHDATIKKMDISCAKT